ncbi:MAG: diguanylate cyclase, partial [Pseudomonadota bacterium]
SYVDLASGARTRISAEDEPNVYTFDIDPDGVVWYGADGIGLVRVEPANSMRRTVFDTSAGFALTSFDHVQWINPKEIWVGTEDGGLYLFDGLRATNIGPETPLRDQTIYLVEKAPDGTLIVGGEEGLYQIDPTTLRSYHYSALSGFVGLESNVHATFMDEGGQLWIGTIAGAAKMDFHRPMPPSIELNPQIVSVATQQTREMVRSGEEVSWNQKGVSTEYVAISLLHPGTIEYSYRLQGLDGSWGPPTRNRRVDYSSLGAGKYVFEVRARFPNQEWGDASATYHFTMLAPYWRQPWFVALALALAVLAVPLLIKLRMRQVEGVNRRLRRDVLERTRSIERAKAHLEATNRRLSKEADERRKSDMARVEVEARFMRAFQSSPIGMALITPEGLLADTNPALQRMLWPDEAQLTDVRRIVDCVAEDERDVFRRLMDKLESGEKDSAEADLRLVSAAGSEVATVVTLSAIRDDRGEYKYSVCQVQDVTEARRMTDQLEYQANYDELTGLLNRRAFEAALARAYREAGNHRTHSFLMFMDLDQFKIVNDTSGHAAGDELLRLVSQLIRDQVRADDVVGRLGGDEFALLLWQCPEHVALRIAESIRSAVEDFQFNWDTETYRIGVSIGAVPLDTSLGDISELQQLADAACFEAKDAGRNRVHVVRTVDDAIKGHRGEAQWVQRLRDAMEHDRFALYGQLIKPVNPNVNEPERMEILLRMRDPATRKLIPPGAFLPAAERYGLSTKLDQWVVENLIRTL